MLIITKAQIKLKMEIYFCCYIIKKVREIYKMNKKPWAEICLIVLGSLLYFMANVQRVAVPGAMFDVLTNDLQTTAQAVTALGSIFMYSYALGQLVIGVLIARFGGFRVVTVGSLMFFVGRLLFPFAQSLPFLYISRLLIGLGSASFYLGMINETRRLVPKKNFGVILSLILLVGYLGGIVANAPLVICIHELGWRDSFLWTGVLTAVLACLFVLIDKTVKHVEIDKTVHMDFELFKKTFSNKKNLNLYAFACFNYGLYYVIQTVIGKKFLEDFCLMPVMKAATILSLMGFMYAIAGSVIAFISKAFLNRRTIFLRISSLNTIIVFGLILFCVCFNVKTPLIAVGFCTISFGASLSPLLVPLLHDYNGSKVANTAVSVMTCGFYIVVALLGSVVGFCLDYFSHLRIESSYIAHNSAYIAIFSVLFLLAIVSFVSVFRIEESKKTLRLIEHIQYIKEREASEEEHWHDEYEHDLYTNI